MDNAQPPLDSAPTPQEAASENEKPTVGLLFSRVSDQVSALVRGEIDLAKAKAKQMATNMGLGAGLLVVAGVLALYGLGWVFYTIYEAAALALPAWAASLVVTGGILLLCALLALVGVSLLKKAKTQVPRPKEAIKQDLQTIKSAVVGNKEQNDD